MSIEKLSPIKTLSSAGIFADAIVTGTAFAQIIVKFPEKSSVPLLVISIRSSCPSKYTSVICNWGTPPPVATPVSISCLLCLVFIQVSSSQLSIPLHDNTWLSGEISKIFNPVPVTFSHVAGVFSVVLCSILSFGGVVSSSIRPPFNPPSEGGPKGEGSPWRGAVPLCGTEGSESTGFCSSEPPSSPLLKGTLEVISSPDSTSPVSAKVGKVKNEKYCKKKNARKTSSTPQMKIFVFIIFFLAN
ncbi:MAG: hypothetical protein CR971_01225 [candidate division SR1 bacterium]|nr:MAG: hypothetical protein CR971_01225 [candidate division SR1 bacterium]